MRTHYSANWNGHGFVDMGVCKHGEASAYFDRCFSQEKSCLTDLFNLFFSCQLMGWSTGTFGLFGLDKNDIKTPAFNFVGIAIVIAGMYVFLQVLSFAFRAFEPRYLQNYTAVDLFLLMHQVKTNEMHSNEAGEDSSTLYQSMLEKQGSGADEGHSTRRPSRGSFSGIHQEPLSDYNADEGCGQAGRPDDAHFGSGWSQRKKRVVGLTMAVVAGLMFGAAFNPAQYVIDNRYDGDDNSLNYVFPHFCGIWLASWWYMILYAFYKYWRNDVMYVNPQSIVPAALAGFMWGIACIAWFVANGKLGFSISFPLITSGPGFVGSMYGIFLFNEISGKNNFMILGAAFAITLVGLAFIASSH